MKASDELEDDHARLGMRAETMAVDQFALERGGEALATKGLS